MNTTQTKPETQSPSRPKQPRTYIFDCPECEMKPDSNCELCNGCGQVAAHVFGPALHTVPLDH